MNNIIFYKNVFTATFLTCFALCSQSVLGQSQLLSNTEAKLPSSNSPYAKNEGGWLDFSDNFVSNAETFITNYRVDLGLESNDSLRLIYTNKDQYGVYKYFQHYYKGIKVAGSEYMFVEKEGKITHAHGNLIKSLVVKTFNDVNREKLLSIAKDALSLTKEAGKEVYESKPEINYKQFGTLEKDNYAHCLAFYIYSEKEETSYKVLVNVSTNQIWAKTPLNQSSNYDGHQETAIGIPLAKPFCTDNSGTTWTLYNGLQGIKTTDRSIFGFYQLIDATYNTTIKTWDVSLQGYPEINSCSNEWTTYPRATSAHWAAEKAYDYFRAFG